MRDPDGVGIRIVVTAVALAVALSVTSCAANEPETAVTLSPLAVEQVAAPTTIPPGPEPPEGGTTTTEPGVAGDSKSSTTSTASTRSSSIPRSSSDDSVEDRPITVVRRGTEGGTKVLVVGVIHGDEDAGADIVDVLRLAEVPVGVELWLVRSMNPDGQSHQVRHNANGVDLNRNFAQNWGPVAEPGNWEYAGPLPPANPRRGP